MIHDIITSGSEQEDRKREEVSRAREDRDKCGEDIRILLCCAVGGSGRFLSFHDSPLLLFERGVHLLFAW